MCVALQFGLRCARCIGDEYTVSIHVCYHGTHRLRCTRATEPTADMLAGDHRPPYAARGVALPAASPSLTAPSSSPVGPGTDMMRAWAGDSNPQVENGWSPSQPYYTEHNNLKHAMAAFAMVLLEPDVSAGAGFLSLFPRFLVPNGTTKFAWDQISFNGGLLHLRAPESGSRLLTSKYSSNRASLRSYGRAIMMENGFWKSELGMQIFAAQLRQIARAAFQTMSMQISRAIVEAAVPQADAGQRGGRMSLEAFYESIEAEVARFACHAKGSRDHMVVVNELRSILGRRSRVSPDTLILPKGLEALVATSPDRDRGQEGYGGLKVVTSCSYDLGPGLPSMDPFQQKRAWGEFVMASSHPTNAVPADKFSNELREVYTFHEQSDEPFRHLLRDLFDNSGLVNPDGRGFSHFGKALFAGEDSLCDYLKRHGVLVSVAESVLAGAREMAPEDDEEHGGGMHRDDEDDYGFGHHDSPRERGGRGRGGGRGREYRKRHSLSGSGSPRAASGPSAAATGGGGASYAGGPPGATGPSAPGASPGAAFSNAAVVRLIQRARNVFVPAEGRVPGLGAYNAGLARAEAALTPMPDGNHSWLSNAEDAMKGHTAPIPSLGNKVYANGLMVTLTDQSTAVARGTTTDAFAFTILEVLKGIDVNDTEDVVLGILPVAIALSTPDSLKATIIKAAEKDDVARQWLAMADSISAPVSAGSRLFEATDDKRRRRMTPWDSVDLQRVWADAGFERNTSWGNTLDLSDSDAYKNAILGNTETLAGKGWSPHSAIAAQVAAVLYTLDMAREASRSGEYEASRTLCADLAEWLGSPEAVTSRLNSMRGERSTRPHVNIDEWAKTLREHGFVVPRAESKLAASEEEESSLSDLWRASSVSEVIAIFSSIKMNSAAAAEFMRVSAHSRRIRHPVDYILFTPHMRWTTGGAAMLASGAQTGVMLYNNPNFQPGTDPNIKVSMAHFTVNLKALVLRPENVAFVPGVFPMSYDGGANATYFNPLDDEHVRAYHQFELGNRDIFVVPVPVNWRPSSWVMDITGKFDLACVDDNGATHHPLGGVIARHWNFRSPNVSQRAGASQDAVQARLNTVCVQGWSRFPQVGPDGNQTFGEIQSKSVRGPFTYSGAAKVRRQRASAYRPAHIASDHFSAGPFNLARK